MNKECSRLTLSHHHRCRLRRRRRCCCWDRLLAPVVVACSSSSLTHCTSRTFSVRSIVQTTIGEQTALAQRTPAPNTSSSARQNE